MQSCKVLKSKSRINGSGDGVVATRMLIFISFGSGSEANPKVDATMGTKKPREPIKAGVEKDEYRHVTLFLVVISLACIGLRF